MDPNLYTWLESEQFVILAKILLGWFALSFLAAAAWALASWNADRRRRARWVRWQNHLRHCAFCQDAALRRGQQP